jgi:hypothetical protein
MAESNRHPIALLAAAASIISILGFLGIKGFGGDPANDPGTGPPPTTPVATTSCPCPTPPAQAVTCTIEDRLGEGQVAEAVNLAIAGRRWTMRISSADPEARVAVRFAQPGSQRYDVTTSTLFDSGATISGHGFGTIECTGGQTYQLAGDYDQNPAQVVLEAS